MVPARFHLSTHNLINGFDNSHFMEPDPLVEALEKATATLSILRFMKREQSQVTLLDSTPVSFSQTTLEGVGCRSLVNGSWGFCSTTNVGDVIQTVEKSERLARIVSGHQRKVEIAPSPPVTGEWNAEVRVSMEDLFERIRDADHAVKDIPAITHHRVSVLLVTDEKIITTTEGTLFHQRESRILCTLVVTARGGGHVARGTKTVADVGDIPQDSIELAHTVSRKLHAPLFHPQRVPVLLASDVVGSLVHEAVGHAAEADVAQYESFLSSKRGEEIAPPSISIADDGTHPKGFGTLGVDDEGARAQYTEILREGVLMGYLHSRETGYSAGASTGNARAWLFSREPMVRMTNTFLLPGAMSEQELVEEVRNGLFLRGSEGGSADRNGQFLFTTTEAQEIENSELTGTYYIGPVISGDTLEAFAACRGVGDTSTFRMHPSLCNKGESAFVGMGGPLMATEMVVG